MTENDYDLRAVIDGKTATDSVANGALLLRFVDAVLGDSEATLAHVRRQLRETMGEAAFCDAAATVASFNAVVKLADGTGIPLEDYKEEATVGLRADLGIDALRG